MNALGLMNENNQTPIDRNEISYLDDFVNGLNRLDQETWEKMRDELANGGQV